MFEVGKLRDKRWRIRPLSPEVRDWLGAHAPEPEWIDGAVIVKRRYLAWLFQGMAEEGFELARVAHDVR